MALSKADLKRIINAVPEPDNDDIGKWVVGVVRAIEAEVRKDDTELIRQLVDALEKIDAAMPFPVGQQAIKAGHARLTPSTAAPRS